MCLDKEAKHNPQQKVTSAQSKKQKHRRGAREKGGEKEEEEERESEENSHAFSLRCREEDIQPFQCKAVWEQAGNMADTDS